MTRDRDILVIGLLLGGVAGGLFTLVAWLSLPTEVRQALMLVVGMLLMAALSALSTYIGSTPILRAAAISTNSAIFLGRTQQSSIKDDKNPANRKYYYLDVIIEEILDRMHLLARQTDIIVRTDRLPFVAAATNLNCNGIIDDTLFQELILFGDKYYNMKNTNHADNYFIDVMFGIGKRLLNQLYEINIANESIQAQARQSSHTEGPPP